MKYWVHSYALAVSYCVAIRLISDSTIVKLRSIGTASNTQAVSISLWIGNKVRMDDESMAIAEVKNSLYF
ncbi:hypothetical protein [Pedobacter aquatilis]|uniref:hypothetical protein n=1 Tax=Pedobacter aquatilis TaxID=351343 RepID=UPI0029308360|nr:hypothetical protein [Pedobacter aquatilis]